MNVAAPVLDESAAIVTFCAVFQLVGVKVRLAPALGDRPVLPDVRPTDDGDVGGSARPRARRRRCW